MSLFVELTIFDAFELLTNAAAKKSTVKFAISFISPWLVLFPVNEIVTWVSLTLVRAPVNPAGVFVKVISPTEVQFNDMPGNNLYNTLGNIYTNSLVNMLFIDFEKNNTYLILGNAKFKKILISGKDVLIVTIKCKEIIKDTNSFLLDYRYK